MRKISIIGTGYVGLVTATAFAEMGNSVLGVDIDENKIARLRSGELTIYEPELEVLFLRSVRESRLRFTTDLADAVRSTELIFLALPTPPNEDGSADLSHVLTVTKEIGDILAADGSTYKLIVIKSTVPVGTADQVRNVLSECGLVERRDYDVVSNPEFLREGVAVSDVMKPERVVVGTASKRAGKIMVELYEPFVRQGNPILVMSNRSAEITKYAANAFLATRISFMNEIANLCERADANVDDVRIAVGLDSRIGKHFLYPGIGFGGSCFPKDVQALVKTAKDLGYDFGILASVLSVNDRQRRLLGDRVVDYFGGNIAGRRIAMWGLAFKPNTDDVREAPALIVASQLAALGAVVSAFDPEAARTTHAVLGDAITYADDAYEALRGADALVICTEWNEFRRPEFDRVKELMTGRAIFDGRNLYDPKETARLGFDYFSIGRPYHKPFVVDAEATASEPPEGLVSISSY